MDLKTSIDRANALSEMLPYIQLFRKKTVVIKYGGSSTGFENIKKTLLEDIALLKLANIRIVLVHGGGKDITAMLNRVGKEAIFSHGLRVTDKDTMDIAEMVLSGHVNKDLVTGLHLAGVESVGISGKDGKTLLARKKYIDGEDIGFVGEIIDVDTSLIELLLNGDYVPVIAPIAADSNGNTYNINADYAAVAIAGKLKSEKLIFLTDTEGVLKDVKKSDSRIDKLNVKDIPLLIENGIISGGMIPKIECCLEAIKQGVHRVHILDGRVEHSILLELFTDSGVGTMLVR